ncbi:putative Lipid transfer-like protein VAS [Cocos nucifera]|uniref:Putative Lipid transfer-like protein VAS n=1 Tax=Cocos nucifera TaxID=13894 RepID=A0A8K0INN1_COCNU|nr:putative Lipid transfer-like protein VAS [Cocos nucifera]
MTVHLIEFHRRVIRGRPIKSPPTPLFPGPKKRRPSLMTTGTNEKSRHGKRRGFGGTIQRAATTNGLMERAREAKLKPAEGSQFGIRENKEGRVREMGFLGQKMAAMVVAVWLVMMAAVARGQQTPTCAANLVPCSSYINNSTKPPESCCGPLKDAVKNQLPCLCALYQNSEILKALHITIDKALNLSRRCGVNSDLSACLGAAAPGSNPSPAAPAGGNGSGSAHRATWFGISGLISLFFFTWSILA